MDVLSSDLPLQQKNSTNIQCYFIKSSSILCSSPCCPSRDGTWYHNPHVSTGDASPPELKVVVSGDRDKEFCIRAVKSPCGCGPSRGDSRRAGTGSPGVRDPNGAEPVVKIERVVAPHTLSSSVFDFGKLFHSGSGWKQCWSLLFGRDIRRCRKARPLA